ncbi:MAG: hypothetical protein JSW16_00145 [Dehalococcoidales bacterium]|nr:MAG: hypothetical protein JSW16_00145 [Dehalococcoidales bacterium]
MLRKNSRFFGLIAVLGVVALMMGACGGETDTETDGDLAVVNASQAKDAALEYLAEKESQDTPDVGTWNEDNVTPPDWVGGSFWEYTGNGWTIKVNHPVVALENTVYTVVVYSVDTGWHWKGTIKADGSVTEVSPFKQVTQEESQNVAGEFVRDDPTFVYDGMEDTLALVDVTTARCPYCWLFTYEFDSRHAGYGDRTGQVLAQVITPHQVQIGVQMLEVTTAVMDGQWDMLRQGLIDGDEVMTVAELLANPVYDNTVQVEGEVALLGELLCPCFELISGGETIQVWYGLMVENDGTERPDVSVEGIKNGDTVTVTGVLKGEGGTHYSAGDFWAEEITVVTSIPDGEIEISLAPIHDVEVLFAESYPVQVFLHIRGGLADGCTTFHGLTEERDGNNINIEVTTQRPKDAICTQVYGFFEKNVGLGIDFISGETYTVTVNDVVTTFVMQ